MPFDITESHALALDQEDPLRSYRERFHIPTARSILGSQAPDEPCVYLTGNSLGLQPKSVRAAIEQELLDWERLGVEGHVHGVNPWLPYHEALRGPLARLVGAQPHEVVAMNSLTVNLHLLMVSFYRPTKERYKIVIEDTAFPSDSYAVASQAACHGHDPRDAVIRLKPRAGERTLRTADVVETIAREGSRIALVMLGGVNYLTGQWFDMPAITHAGHRAGAVVGWDLAHAAGNVPVRLHDTNIDFAVWCSYKYLNSGPGAIAGAYVHERHCRDEKIPQFAGWWGNDPKTRFVMGPEFAPVHSADRWALSNPPILSMTPVRESLAIFDAAGIDTLRGKSLKLTGYMAGLLKELAPGIEIHTPDDASSRGCQLSLALPGDPRECLAALKQAGVVCDFREPNIIRAAPTPLYNTFHDVWRFVRVVGAIAGAKGTR